MELIGEAVGSGARVGAACRIIGISSRTYLRWKLGHVIDRRKGAAKRVPRKLSEAEAERFYQEANAPRFRDMTAAQIVAILSEEGVYYGSERTLYRILKAKNALVSRTESRKPGVSRKPPELVATGPNQVWSWDITWVKTDVKGIFLFAYVVLDVFSRKIVGWSDRRPREP